MGAAICSAVNDWIIEHWLNKEPRLRASIVVPAQAPLLAVEEIERLRRRQALRADPDAGGVRDDAGPQLLLADLRGGGEARSADRPARRQHVSLRADLGRLAVASICTTTSRSRNSFEDQLLSLISNGVFNKFPGSARRVDRVRRDLAARLSSGARSRPGAACAPRCRG